MSQNFRVTDSIDHEKWADFVYNHPHGNIFQTPEMREVYKRTKNYEPITLAAVSGILAHLKRRHDSFCAWAGVCKTWP